MVVMELVTLERERLMLNLAMELVTDHLLAMETLDMEVMESVILGRETLMLNPVMELVTDHL